MNILTDTLPTAVMIDGVPHKINSDFRICLRALSAFEDRELSKSEKQAIMIKLMYGDNIPNNIEAACMQACKFLDCGKTASESDDEPTDNVGRLYSFSQDNRYIFTAINQTHGIDLNSVEYMHWWKFFAYFLDLSEDCFFSRLIYLRKQKKTGKLTKEEREWYDSIREIADLPEDEISDENLNELLSRYGR